MNKLAIKAFVLITVVSLIILAFTYNRANFKVIKTVLQSHITENTRNKEVRNSVLLEDTKKECESAIKSDYFKNISHYCQSPCTKLTVKQIVKKNMFFYNDRYKFVFCTVPKAGVTNWRRVLLVLSGKLNVTDPMEIDKKLVFSKYYRLLSRLGSLSESEIEYRLKHYYKFVFVRDPFVRLVSAYQDKLVRNKDFARRVSVERRIIQSYRIRPSRKALRRDRNVRFEEFVQHVADSSIYKLNRHWRPMSLLCEPCSIKYDFVGHVENVDSDSQRVLHEILGVRSKVKYPSRSDYTNQESETLLEDMYSKIPLAHLSELKHVYSLDYLLFNLTIPRTVENLLKRL